MSAHSPAVDQSQSKKNTTQKKRALLVDDDDFVRDIAGDALESLGFTVTSASGGEEALEIAQSLNGAFELVLTDVVMPGMDGVQFAEEFNRRYPDIPVVFMSGFTPKQIMRHGVDKINTTVLAKPFTVAELDKAVNSVLVS